MASNIRSNPLRARPSPLSFAKDFNLQGQRLVVKKLNVARVLSLWMVSRLCPVFIPPKRADGKTIVTIEGLAQRVHEEMKLHPLQEAFVEHGAVQCGFCIPGQIMTAYALLKHNPNPDSADIRFALKDTLCRCAGYPSIENAILAAAQALRTGEPVQKPSHIPDSIHITKQSVIRTCALKQWRRSQVKLSTPMTLFSMACYMPKPVAR